MVTLPLAEAKVADRPSPFHVIQPNVGEQAGGGCGCGKGGTQSSTALLARELAEIIRKANLSVGSPNPVGQTTGNNVAGEMPDATYHIDGSSPLLLCEELAHHLIEG